MSIGGVFSPTRTAPDHAGKRPPRVSVAGACSTHPLPPATDRSILMNTLNQSLLILGMFRAGEPLTTPAVGERLATAGYNLTDRSVQRNLERLMDEGYLECMNPGGRPLQWRWPKAKKSIALPRLASHEVLAFRLLERFLQPLLPRETYVALRPYFAMAQRELELMPSWAALRHWEPKVQVLPPMQPLLPPEPIAATAKARDAWPEQQRTVRDTLLTALFKEQQCIVEYQQPWRDEPVCWTVHPFVFVQRGPAFYLLGNIAGYDDVRPMALHRMRSVVLKDDPAHKIKDFDLDEAAAVRRFQGMGGSDEPLRLVARFYRPAGLHLLETRLSEDQVVQDRDGDDYHFRLTATVNDTAQLRWWLLSFGSKVEVLAPETLRTEMAQHGYWMQRMYAKPSPAGTEER